AYIARRASALFRCYSRWWRNRAAYPAAARFFTISRLRLSASRDSSSSFAFSRKASSPPRWSTDLSALADTRSLTERLSASEMKVTLHRLGRNRRLVLRFEWLTLWPVCAALPVKSHRRDMGIPRLSVAARRTRSRLGNAILLKAAAPYSGRFIRRQGTADADAKAARGGARTRGSPAAHGWFCRSWL